MKILVAGGCGYIGSVLVPKLISKGHDITVVDLCWFGNYLSNSIKLIKKDIQSLQEIDLVGFDQVIFLAGISNDPMAEYSPINNFIGNVAIPTYLAYISKKAKVKRFIYASSCSVYGFTNNLSCNETSLTNSQFPYGVSKLQGEFGCLQLQDENFSVISFRKGTVCGRSPRMRFDLVINAMFKSAIQEQNITVNNPDLWRPILSIQDATDAYVKATECNNYGVYNVSGGNYTILQIANEIKNSLPFHVDIVIKNNPDQRNYKVSTSKIENELGFYPKYNIKDICNELLLNLDKYKDLNHSKYYNIQVFKNL